MDFRHWIRGLVAAVIGGGANAVTVIILDPINFNLFQGGATKLGMATLVSAIVSAALYLKQSPLPAESVTVETTRTETVNVTNKE